jgi:hypothetical protein
MTSFASLAGTVTNTLNSGVQLGSAMYKLLTWAANPHVIVPAAIRPPGVMARRPLPALTGGTDLLDFED